MAKPSKLKRAIREMEEKIEGHILKKIQLEGLINNGNAIIEMLRKIDNEKRD